MQVPIVHQVAPADFTAQQAVAYADALIVSLGGPGSFAAA
jgi:hypothetical protein